MRLGEHHAFLRNEIVSLRRENGVLEARMVAFAREAEELCTRLVEMDAGAVI
jgi:hypothetical protein